MRSDPVLAILRRRALEPERIRTRYNVQGQVQGVGFRPSAYRLAQECSLAGYVANDGRGIEIEVEGGVETADCPSDRPSSLPLG